jgi:HK97 family phage prohead protease
MDKKSAVFELKELSESGSFVGHAAVFGNIDLGGDIIARNAFKKTISDRNGRFPLKDSHDKTIGVAEVWEDEYGLATKGQINLDTQIGRDVHSNMRFLKANGVDPGMSIGYIPVADKIQFKNGVRTLGEVKLLEVTVTDIPMNEAARVVAVKSQQHDELKSKIEALEVRLSALEEKAVPPAPAAPAPEPEPAVDHSAIALALTRLRLSLPN